MPYDEFVDRVDRLVDRIHGSAPAPGVDRIYVPGERSAEVARERMRNGIPIRTDLVAELDRFGAEIGVRWN